MKFRLNVDLEAVLLVVALILVFFFVSGVHWIQVIGLYNDGSPELAAWSVAGSMMVLAACIYGMFRSIGE